MAGDETFRHFTVLKAANAVPGGAQVPVSTLFAHDNLRLSIYAPRGEDRQQPHGEDEIYMVIRGSGHFTAAGKRCAIHAGDVLFVPAGVAHRFERFTDDLLLWVIFYGGKAKAAAST